MTDKTSREALEAVDRGASNWVGHGREYLALAGTSQFGEAHDVLREEMLPVIEEAEKAARALSQREREALVASNRQAHADISASRWAASILIGLNLFMAGAVFWIVSRIRTALGEAVAEMSDTAASCGVIEARNGGRTIAGERGLRAGGLHRANCQFQCGDLGHDAPQRGVRSDASLITCKFNGRFETDPELQRRFMDLARTPGSGR